ncbi:hypothetical protein CEXT_749021 [Caerostris extrusa]|uniref:Uncharacterized protein n=1 Tax=Caerostris extrusa TaxID=172846 RepID=A0AAV4VUM0_CAEEX|nr:hypothetical protein CEXT_749021 [Caerostris extrusa]
MEKEIMEVGETETNTSSKNAKGSGIKLKLLSEKNKPLELNPTKEPEAKPKQKVVYIGRAPNFKSRPGHQVSLHHSPKVQGMEKEIMEVGETETNTSSKNAKGSGIKLKLLSEKKNH